MSGVSLERYNQKNIQLGTLDASAMSLTEQLKVDNDFQAIFREVKIQDEEALHGGAGASPGRGV